MSKNFIAEMHDTAMSLREIADHMATLGLMSPVAGKLFDYSETLFGEAAEINQLVSEQLDSLLHQAQESSTNLLIGTLAGAGIAGDKGSAELAKELMKGRKS